MILLVKVKLALIHFANTFTADNKDAFRRYKGVEILVEMLRIHKDAQVAKALFHVLNGNGKKKLILIIVNIIFSVKMSTLINTRQTLAKS